MLHSQYLSRSWQCICFCTFAQRLDMFLRTHQQNGLYYTIFKGGWRMCMTKKTKKLFNCQYSMSQLTMDTNHDLFQTLLSLKLWPRGSAPAGSGNPDQPNLHSRTPSEALKEHAWLFDTKIYLRLSKLKTEWPQWGNSKTEGNDAK